MVEYEGWSDKFTTNPSGATLLTPRHRQLLEEDNHIIWFAGAEVLNAVTRCHKLDIGKGPDGRLVGSD